VIAEQEQHTSEQASKLASKQQNRVLVSKLRQGKIVVLLASTWWFRKALSFNKGGKFQSNQK